MLNNFKNHCVRKLVQFVSSLMDRCYVADQLRNQQRIAALWALAFRRLYFLLKIAEHLDREATGEQMANEGWWG